MSILLTLPTEVKLELFSQLTFASLCNLLTAFPSLQPLLSEHPFAILPQIHLRELLIEDASKKLAPSYKDPQYKFHLKYVYYRHLVPALILFYKRNVRAHDDSTFWCVSGGDDVGSAPYFSIAEKEAQARIDEVAKRYEQEPEGLLRYWLEMICVQKPEESGWIMPMEVVESLCKQVRVAERGWKRDCREREAAYFRLVDIVEKEDLPVWVKFDRVRRERERNAVVEVRKERELIASLNARRPRFRF